jgi:hypothetical protein
MKLYHLMTQTATWYLPMWVTRVMTLWRLGIVEADRLQNLQRHHPLVI